MNRIASILTVAVSLCVAVTFAGGCRGAAGGPELADVSGQLLWYGQPVPGNITFEPIGKDGQLRGRPSTGTADEQGRYRLSYAGDRYGAEVGLHRVTIRILPIVPEGRTGSFTAVTQVLKETHLQRRVFPETTFLRFSLTY